MGKAIFLLLLSAVSGNALADWVSVLAGATDANSYYADPATIRKAGSKVKMWTLVDHRAALTDSFGKSHASEKVQWEYECKEGQLRMLAYVTFTENLAKGKAVYSDSEPGKWRPLSADAAESASWKLACGKK